MNGSSMLGMTYILLCVCLPILILCIVILMLSIHRKLAKLQKTIEHLDQVETMRANKEFGISQ